MISNNQALLTSSSADTNKWEKSMNVEIYY